MPIQQFGTFLPQFTKMHSDNAIDIYIDTTEYHPNSNIKIFFQCEPTAIQENMNHFAIREYLKNNYEKYTYIFCYNPEEINCPNALPKIEAGTWIEKSAYSTIDAKQKTFQISNITGFKAHTVGHLHRHELYINQKSFEDFPIVFFRSSAPPIIPEISKNPFIPKDLASKILLFESFQYSIVIENSQEKNYFSEKLMDCLITKTIPIYYGCPNISEYFDTTGWIILTDNNFVENLYYSLQKLTPTYYEEHLAIVEKNYQKALELADSTVNYYNYLSKVLPLKLTS